MIRLILSASAVAILAVATLACDGYDSTSSPTPAPPTPTVTATTPTGDLALTEADNGRPFTVATGGTITVTLLSNPTTGFSWAVKDLPAQLRQEGAPVFTPDVATTPMPGTGGTETFTFTAVSAGTAQLRLVYERSFESVPPNQVFEATVVVQ